MSDNVFDWTASQVLRGGSWDGDQWLARCVCRARFSPVNFNFNFGFRVVVPLVHTEF